VMKKQRVKPSLKSEASMISTAAATFLRTAGIGVLSLTLSFLEPIERGVFSSTSRLSRQIALQPECLVLDEDVLKLDDRFCHHTIQQLRRAEAAHNGRDPPTTLIAPWLLRLLPHTLLIEEPFDLTPVRIRQLIHLTSLRELYIWQPEYTGLPSLYPLRALTQLNTLQLDYAMWDHLHALAPMTSLTAFSSHDPGGVWFAAHHALNLPSSLTSLARINTCSQDEDHAADFWQQFCAHLPLLSQLTIAIKHDFPAAHTLTHLTELTIALSSPELTLASLHLTSLPALKELGISSFVPPCLTLLSTLPALESLTLCARLHDPHIVSLCKLPPASLRSLTLPRFECHRWPTASQPALVCAREICIFDGCVCHKK
jgi:hypothetical protein